MSDKNGQGKEPFEGVDNSALLQAMKETKEKKSKEAEWKVLTELEKAAFVTPAIVSKEEDGGMHIQFMTIKDQDGKQFLPAFTSDEELKKYRKDVNLQVIKCRLEQYIDVITSDEKGPFALVVDPYGENVVLTREFLVSIKEYSIKEDFSKVTYIDEDVHPEEMEKTLKEFFDAEGTVDKAYFQLLERGGEIYLMLVLDNKYPDAASEEEIQKLRRNLFDRTADKIKPEFLRSVFCDMQFTITDSRSDTGKEIVEIREAFYTRG